MSRKLSLALSAGLLSIMAVVGVQLAAAQAGVHRGDRGGARAATGSAMCGVRTAPGTYTHVITIFMENNSYNTIQGSSSAPYIHSLANQCGLATNYHNISHPSLPNYIAATTGANLDQVTPFTSDCSPSQTCQWTGPNIFYQLNLRHRRWRNYAESMPSACDKSNSGFYAPRHNPAVYDTDLSNCAANDVPLGTTSSSALLKDFASSSGAPAFAFVTPNLCNDMHGAGGCPSNSIQTGDNWLKLWLPKIASTAAYKAGHTAILLTWDEGEPGTSGEGCATNTSDQGCRVVTIVIAPSVAHGKKVATLFNHYSLLKTAEDLLGLPELNQAKTAASMVKPFNL
jgi:hypothetical protein